MQRLERLLRAECKLRLEEIDRQRRAAHKQLEADQYPKLAAVPMKVQRLVSALRAAQHDVRVLEDRLRRLGFYAPAGRTDVVGRTSYDQHGAFQQINAEAAERTRRIARIQHEALVTSLTVPREKEAAAFEHLRRSLLEV